MTDPSGFSLIEIADKIRDRQISSVEITTILLTRIARCQPVINAFIQVHEDRALNDARAADEELCQQGPRGPLHGVPLAHKDMFDRPGEIVTYGSRMRRNARADVHATVLRRLDAAGAVTLGTLNMAEFAYSPTGANTLTGIARNPWNPAHICGGSSSGSAAALAARLCFGALGSDTGGSIRQPAAICGVVGLKPTFGRVSLHGAMPLSFSLDCVGPLARTVCDAARLMSIIAGPDPADPSTLPEPVPDYEMACRPLRRATRIGVPHEYFWHNVEPRIGALLEDVIGQASRAGMEIARLHIPDLAPVVAAANILIGADSAALHRRTLASDPDAFGAPVRARIENGLGYTAQDYIDALKYRATALARFLAAMNSVEVLAVPCLAIPTPTIAETENPSFGTPSSLAALLTYWVRPVNFLGLPAISVPCGFGPDGLPIGIQLIGKPFQEARLLEVACFFEAIFDLSSVWPNEL